MTAGTEAGDAIYQPLTDDGTATGAFNVVGNYASPTEIYFENTQRAALLTRMVVSLSDAGAFDADKYGNSITLANGINLKVVDADDNVIVDLVPEGNIKTNAEWAAKCHDFTEHGFGVGNVWGSVRWTFAKDVPGGLVLGAGDRFVATFQDDFSGLIRHRFDIRGKYL